MNTDCGVSVCSGPDRGGWLVVWSGPSDNWRLVRGCRFRGRLSKKKVLILIVCGREPTRFTCGVSGVRDKRFGVLSRDDLWGGLGDENLDGWWNWNAVYRPRAV